MSEHTAKDELERKLLAWSRKKRNRATLEYFFGMRESVENKKMCEACGGVGIVELDGPNGVPDHEKCPDCTGKKGGE